MSISKSKLYLQQTSYLGNGQCPEFAWPQRLIKPQYVVDNRKSTHLGNCQHCRWELTAHLWQSMIQSPEGRHFLFCERASKVTQYPDPVIVPGKKQTGYIFEKQGTSNARRSRASKVWRWILVFRLQGGGVQLSTNFLDSDGPRWMRTLWRHGVPCEGPFPGRWKGGLRDSESWIVPRRGRVCSRSRLRRSQCERHVTFLHCVWSGLRQMVASFWSLLRVLGLEWWLRAWIHPCWIHNNLVSLILPCLRTWVGLYVGLAAMDYCRYQRS